MPIMTRLSLGGGLSPTDGRIPNLASGRRGDAMGTRMILCIKLDDGCGTAASRSHNSAVDAHLHVEGGQPPKKVKSTPINLGVFSWLYVVSRTPDSGFCKVVGSLLAPRPTKYRVLVESITRDPMDRSSKHFLHLQ